jgi:hypothetical protein
MKTWNYNRTDTMPISYTIIIKSTEHIPSIFNDESTRSFIHLRRHIHVTRIPATHIIFTRISCTLFTCDMYMCRLSHIHDPVLSSLKMKGIRLLFFFIIISLPPTPSCNKWHHTYGYVMCSKANAARKGWTSSDVTIWRLGARHTIK